MGWITKGMFYGLGGLMLISMCSKLTKQSGSNTSAAASGVPTPPSLASAASAPSEAEPTAPIIKPERVSAARVASDFDKNEVSAEDRYKNKCFDLTGTVESIDAGLGDDATLVLRAGYLGVMVSDIPRAFAGSLSKGDSVEIPVKGIGEILGRPVASFDNECARMSAAAEAQDKAKKATDAAAQKAKKEAAKAAKAAKPVAKGQSKGRLELPCKPGQTPPCYE